MTTDTHKPLLDDIDRENLLEISSHLTTLADDEHLVVDNARALAAWVTTDGTQGDARMRMEALGQAHRNLKRMKRTPMDRPEELTARAETFYRFIAEGAAPQTDDVAYITIREPAY